MRSIFLLFVALFLINISYCFAEEREEDDDTSEMEIFDVDEMEEFKVENGLSEGTVQEVSWEKRKWPDATVYYTFDPDLLDVRDDLRKVMNILENSTCIKFKVRNNETDFVSFIKSPNKECLGGTGRMGGEQTFLLSEKCETFGFYFHVIMQLLGFYHEHQRWDRDDFITLNETNIEDAWKWTFEKLDPTFKFRNTPYDTHSSMHFGSYQFSKNGEPVFLTKKGELIESWYEKDNFSPLDILDINYSYECNCKCNKNNN